MSPIRMNLILYAQTGCAITLSFTFIHVHTRQQNVKDKTYRTLEYGT